MSNEHNSGGPPPETQQTTSSDPIPETPKEMGSVVGFRLFAIVAITLAFIGVIIFGIWHPSFLDKLSQINVARGFITFLVALGTIALAILLVIYAITFRRLTDKDDAAFKDRFGRGQQVFTALVGILGTIVGFYFGSTVTETKKPLSVNPVIIDNSNPKPGDTIKFTNVVKGGQAPYTYSLKFDPKEISPIEDKTTDTGDISEQIKIKNETKPGTVILITFEVTDKTGETRKIGKDKNPKIKVAEKEPAPSKRPKRR
jgi:uncharacterized membrane protein YhaH (DUF805 family)